MAKNVNKEPKKYAAFDGKLLFEYKGSRDAGIRFYNSTHFSFGKPLPSTRLSAPIEFLDWYEMTAKINSIDEKTAAEMEIVRKRYYAKKMAMERELMESLVFPAIDKLIGFDKVIEEMQK